MIARTLLFLALSLPLSQAETILGVYIFHRHGDRTDKEHPPSNLTELGFNEVYNSGQYYRNRYVSSSASNQIFGINSDVVNNQQLNIQAPDDSVLVNSASGFAQGLYPPVNPQENQDTLRNGTQVQGPLNGLQLIPVHSVHSGHTAGSSTWMQGSSGCTNAEKSSSSYSRSGQFYNLVQQTNGFYQSISPTVNDIFNQSEINYNNAYSSKLTRLKRWIFLIPPSVYDVLNVANIHNQTFPASNLLTDQNLFQLQMLADQHEYNLAYDSGSPIRAIAGATLAAQIVQGLNNTIVSQGLNLMTVQLGTYSTFLSFFGLAQLNQADPQFYGIPQYASSMSFELFTDDNTPPFPNFQDVQVRMLWSNGTASNTSPPIAFPLFGQQQTAMPWASFVNSMNKFAVGSQAQWCQQCGNSSGICADPVNQPGRHITKTVAGVIGAMVTLAVILGLASCFILTCACLRRRRARRADREAAIVEKPSARPPRL